MAGPAQIGPGEGVFQGLGAKGREQIGFGRLQVHVGLGAPEPAGIVEPPHAAIGQRPTDAVMGQGWHPLGIDPHRPGHAQVQTQPAAIVEIHQQVLGPASDRADAAAHANALQLLAGEWLAQAIHPQLHRGHCRARQVTGQRAADGLDFG